MKHDHKKTKKLKIALFSMIMFLPFIAIGVTCATHIFNKEVTEETETATINYMYETETPQQNAPLKNNYIYTCTLDNSQIQNTATYFLLITERTTNNTILKIQIENIRNTYIWIEQNGDTIEITDNINYDIITIIDNDNQYLLTWQYNDYIQEQEGTTDSNIYNFYATPQELIPIESVNIETHAQDQTTNIFYDSCSQVEQSFILNWCEQANPVRGPIQSFTTAFSLPNEHIINTLITYWICIAMIYIVIDIIVECVIMITHFFNKEF